MEVGASGSSEHVCRVISYLHLRCLFPILKLKKIHLSQGEKLLLSHKCWFKDF